MQGDCLAEISGGLLGRIFERCHGECMRQLFERKCMGVCSGKKFPGGSRENIQGECPGELSVVGVSISCMIASLCV